MDEVHNHSPMNTTTRVVEYGYFTRGDDMRLITPWGDPFEHEHPFDYRFASEEEARAFFDDYFEDWDPEDRPAWELCRITIESLDF